LPTLGAGIKQGTTVADAVPARLLDLSRSVSRAGRIPTGIDRVELAYLRAFLAETVPVFALTRTAWGYVLLDRNGCRVLLDRLDGRVPWGKVDRLSSFRRNLPESRKRAEADLRRIAIARCLPFRLGYMLARMLPQGASYVNVGHANLNGHVLRSTKNALGGPVVVLIHDTIPLDFPQFQRSGSVDRFRLMLDQVRQHASLILCNSEQTRRDVIRHMSHSGKVPEILAAGLGIEVPVPDPHPVYPDGFDPDRAFFVTVGTIEPRKNHMFLLDLWREMTTALPHNQIPQLLICGGRGWNNADVFARLDSDPIMGRHVFEMSGLSDGQIASLLRNARGALFPSHSEGFGLPPVEALAQGVQVICNDLGIYHEILSDYPVYASVQDRYLWRKEILKMASGQKIGQIADTGFEAPSWRSHFNTVLSRL
jgi:glycosyltransferase involved in cell wall biosynthesis